jgi:hypothetical protein
MLYKSFLALVLVLSILLVSQKLYSKFQGDLQEVVVITDKDIAIASNDINEKGEIMISDSDIKEKQIIVPIADDGSFEITQNNNGSDTILMVDGMGNKTETIKFNNHSRLKMIVVQTSNRGVKRVYIYGQNGKVKRPEPNKLESIFSSTPDEIANAVGLYETADDRERRKKEKIEARNDRLREVQMKELLIPKNSIPEPVYPENNPTRKAENNESENPPVNENRQQPGGNERSERES